MYWRLDVTGAPAALPIKSPAETTSENDDIGGDNIILCPKEESSDGNVGVKTIDEIELGLSL
jgi:hypothetical protein